MALTTKLTTKNSQLLIRFYEKTIQGLLQRIEGFSPDDEALDTLQAEVEGVLDELERTSVEFANIELPDNYSKGLNEANKILSAIGVQLTTPSRGAHEAVVRQMVREMELNFAKGINATRGGIRTAISMSERELLRSAFADFDTRANAKKEILHILKTNGVQSIVDRGGKNWKLDTYVDMLTRTTARAAYNQGMVNRSLELGQKVFRVSFSGTKHKECAVWERQLLTINGEFGLPTIQEATAAGLFHPNCFHRLQPDPQAQMLLEDGDAQARAFAN